MAWRWFGWLMLVGVSVAASAVTAGPGPEPGPGVGPGVGASALPSGGDVAVIRVEGLIYDFTLQSLQRRVDRAIQSGATVIVLELDTPGGVVTSALKISKYLKGLQVPTVAWINSEAYSAGIMVAAACDQVVMSPSSATGDCAPIVPGQELSPTERAKALSPILEEFRDSATRNGYDFALFHAMCVLGVEVYQVEHVETGERRLVNQADYAFMVQGVEPTEGGVLQRVFGGGASTAPSADPVGAPVRELAEPGDRGMWRLVDQVHDGKTLLTLNQTRAQAIGLARAIVKDEAELKQYLGAATVRPVKQSWSESLAGWLVHPAVRAVLIAMVLLCGYMEMQSPGVGLPGAIAALALIVLVGSPFLIGLAEVWHVLVLALGVLLLMVELFVLPGFGVAGVTGIVCMVVGLVFMAVPTSGSGVLPLPPQEMVNLLQRSALATIFGLMVGTAAVAVALRNMPRLPGAKRLILTADQPSSASVIEPEDPTAVRAGASGKVVSELRPSGRAAFGPRIVDVVTRGEWLDVGAAVRVVEVRGNRVVVEPASA